jgi:hypothetical protein
MLKTGLALAFSLLTLGSAPAQEWSEGGLYVVPNKSADGGASGFVPLKILKLDERGVHVRVYSNVYPRPPKRIDESKLYMAGRTRGKDEPLGMGHLPVSRESFASWGARFVQPSRVAPQELEGYEIWREAKGGYF